MNTRDEARAASVRAYSSLRFRGRSDYSAFDSAVLLFRMRFPRVAAREARFVVAGWICDALEPEAAE